MRFSHLFLLMLVALLSACRPYVMSNSAVDQFPKSDQELDFLSAVEKMPAVTNNDAIHGFFLLQDGDDPNADYAARMQAAAKRGWLPSDDKHLPNAAAKVGWMATAGCIMMNVKGGFTMQVFGPISRYATKELIYMEILPLRSENQILTGAEFVDYLNRLDRIAGKNRRVKPATPLGVPAGEAAISPGNEGAIQEGSLPEQGPRQAPLVPVTAPEHNPSALPQPAPPDAKPSSVPGTMRPSNGSPPGS